MTARLLIIAVDGGDGGQLDRHSADGSLPHLAALRTRGAAVPLCPPPGITDDAVWASFHYGVGLGEHGRYHYRLPLRDGRLGDAHRQEAQPIFWHELSDAGLRIAILDAPKCRDPRPLNGIHLADWSVHGRYFAEPRSQPPTLAAEVVERFGPALQGRCDYAQPLLDADEIRARARDLRTSVAQKAAAGLYYLESEAWDLFVIGFKETHCASHALWDDTLPSSEPIMAILRDIDAAIGTFVAAAGPLAEVVVFSTTAYQPNGSLDHLMPGIVERLNSSVLSSRWSLSSGRCAILPCNENCAALRVTRACKLLPTGGAPADDDLRIIEAELRRLRDADTGLSVVADVTRLATDCTGARAATLPDLLVHCASGAFPRAVESLSLGRIEGKAAVPMRPGNHVAGGFLIAAGQRASTLSAHIRTTADIAALARAVLASD